MKTDALSYRRQIQLVIFSGLVQGLFYLRNILFLPLLTRCLGVELFGVWSKMHALSNLATPLLGLGIIAGLSRLLPSTPPDRRGPLFWSAGSVVAASAVLGVALLLLLRPQLVELLYQAAPAAISGSMLAALGGIALTTALGQMAVSYYRLLDRPIPYGWGTVMQLVLLLVALAGCWWIIGRSLWVPLYAWMIGPGIVVLYLLFRIRQETAVRADVMGLREMLRFGVPLLPATLVIWVIDFADRYLMTWLIPSDADAIVGVYGANYAFGGIVVMAFGPFFLFYTPAVTRLWDRGDLAEVGHLTRQTVKYAVIVAVPILFAAPLLGGKGIRLIAGDQFQAHQTVIGLIMLGYFLYMLGVFAQTPLLMEKRSWAVFGITGIAAVINVCLGYLLIPLPPPWGQMQGAALATVCSFTLFLLANCYATRKVSLGWRCLAGIAAIAMLAASIVVVWTPRSPVSWGASILVAGAFYCAGLLTTGIVRRSELRAAAAAVRGLVRE